MSAAARDWSVGVDVGGTKVVAGLVDARGEVRVELRHEHAGSGYDAIVDGIADFVGQLVEVAGDEGGVVRGVGVAVAAFLTADRAHVRQAANLGWDAVPLHDELEARLQLPVTIENDADAAAWGEWRFGAGRGERCVLLATLGTGVGGGIVHHGHLLSGGNGLAGEIGHLQVERDGRPCPCGARGCLEQYASGTALVGAARVAAAERPADASELLALAGGDPAAISGTIVSAAAARGDAEAVQACRTIGGWLGLGLAQACAVIDPSVILLGGGASAAGRPLLDAVQEAVARNVGVAHVRPRTPVRLAALGNVAGLVGAADLARAEAARRAETKRFRANANADEAA